MEDLSLLGIAVKEGEGQKMSIDSIPGTSKGGSRKLAIIFTCSVCETRSAKKFTERAYNHGVVLVRCPKCDNLHLIADNLGYFTDDKDGWNIEKLKDISEQENVLVSGDDEVLELAYEDSLDVSTTDDNNT
jgi:protein import protein ZIM17